MENIIVKTKDLLKLLEQVKEDGMHYVEINLLEADEGYYPAHATIIGFGAVSPTAIDYGVVDQVDGVKRPKSVTNIR